MIPLSIVAGDTVSFLAPGSSYPAPAWTVKMAIATATPVILESTPSVPDVPNHRLTMTSEESALVPYGRHGYSLVWSGPADARVTDGSGRILVLPDPLSPLKASWAMQCLVKVEAAILKLSGNTNAQVIVDGEQYTKRNFKELCDYRDRLIATVEAELISIGRPVSRGGVKTIRTRFVN